MSGRASAVMANTPVTVMWRSGGLRMEMEGRAVETAPSATKFACSIPGTSRTIRGVVIGDGMIEVRSEP